MIVACEKCHTRFQLDDARVPETGVRVRCSRCKHAFFATRVGSSPDEVTHALAHAAASHEGASAPEATHDLSIAVPAQGGTLGDISGATRAFEGRVGADLGDDTRATKAGPNGRGATRESDDESDWQFNDERPPTGPGGRGAAARAESRGTNEASIEELGSPESWDFLASGETAPAAGSEAAGAAARGEGASQAPAQLGGATGGAERRVAATSAALRAPADALALRLSRAVTAAGWAATGLLLALIAGASLAPRSQPTLVLPATWPVGRLAWEGLTVRLVDNAVAGPVLVVSGRLRNPTSAPAALGATLEVTLIGDGVASANAPATGPAALAGRGMSEESLRERETESVRTELAASAAGLAWTELAPGEEIALDAVLPEVPLGASAFSVAVRPAEPPPPPPPPVQIVVPEAAPPAPPPAARERRARPRRAAS